MSAAKDYSYETLQCSFTSNNVLHVQLNRPKNLNSLNDAMWREFQECFKQIKFDPNVRVVILSGSGRLFCAGLDLKEAATGLTNSDESDVGRRAYRLRKKIMDFQASFSAIQDCDKPVIAAVHGGCIGGGIDMITSCDIRYCSEDAFFSVKEVDIGMAADVGTLQRLQKVVSNDSWTREICFTARIFDSKEALRHGLVSDVFPKLEDVLAKAKEIGKVIASKSPVAVSGTKHLLNYSRDHTVEEGLTYSALWNASMLQSEDLEKAIVASISKQNASFSKL
ncbi:ClpP/crotonase [Basidiobolus meristosporus CBS 931.73]|uniref:ClpP/crotonase n=1 Tax=Basidiobolus meristosporus CBS 931.73 TaxID=1314790 RepID=A0A1Y1XX38_9FUNG|nr:ClpP/crotonase [Basidiobolus meristosporus CBS 931.73]|eukprot:ORX89924.1 ClpP/crotonase [Basidiobolus meristosporus CBS 931.73]